MESTTGISTVEKGGPLDAVRGFGTMVGPSVVLDGIFLGAAATLVAGTVRKRKTTAGKLALAGAMLLAPLPAAYLLGFRESLLNWGSTPEDRWQVLPGDDLLPPASITRAIGIDAPAGAVWPWVAQLGQDRGGFYSYTWLENLAGCRMPNASTIHPEWQHREVGETIRLHPMSGLKVTLFEDGRALGIQGWGNLIVQPVDAKRCRLLIREPRPTGPGGLAYLLTLELPHFIMERKMLLTIKERAERAPVACTEANTEHTLPKAA
jgi:hypothetical protein